MLAVGAVQTGREDHQGLVLAGGFGGEEGGRLFRIRERLRPERQRQVRLGRMEEVVRCQPVSKVAQVKYPTQSATMQPWRIYDMVLGEEKIGIRDESTNLECRQGANNAAQTETYKLLFLLAWVLGLTGNKRRNGRLPRGEHETETGIMRIR